MKHITRFRVYQLGSAGASMSLSVNDHFTLIEARYNKDNKDRIKKEIELLHKQRIDTLHITSWDEDHCKATDLSNILKELKPICVEYPGYKPTTENGDKCLNIINAEHGVLRIPITPEAVRKCPKEKFMGRDVLYSPFKTFKSSNDNSVVKFFRQGSFKILSLGDCESDEISEYLQNEDILQNEVDVLILSHHGSTNSVISPQFLDAIMPNVAVCPVDYANKSGRPEEAIYKWLNDRNIKYLSSMTGDILIQTKDKYSYIVSKYSMNNKILTQESICKSKTYYLNDED